MAERGRDGVVAAILGVAVLALLARLVLLDARVAHWDEARVGYRILEYAETGVWEYRPIVHGPLLFHVDRWVFETLGAGDATARLVVALVGGTLPVSALLFRGRLADDETVALAVVLAADPLLVFYSRFVRNDLLVGAFALWTLGLLLRARDAGRARRRSASRSGRQDDRSGRPDANWTGRLDASRARRIVTSPSAFALAAAGTLALAFATKENAVLYLLSWGGAALLVGFLFERPGSPLAVGEQFRAAVATLRGHLSGAARAVLGRPGTAVAAAVEFLAVVVILYAPRGSSGATLGNALADPSLWPAVVRAATLGSARKLVDLWLLGGLQHPSYARYLGMLLALVLLPSLAAVACAVVGLRAELGGNDGERAGRDGPDRQRGSPRWLVAFAAAWAVLGLVGYPAASDLVAGWTAVHVVVPLTIPAAVGLAALVRRARPAAGAIEPGERESTRPASGERGSTRSTNGERNATRPASDERDTPRPVPDERDGIGPESLRALALLVLLVAHAVGVGAVTSYVAPGHQENVLGQPAQGGDDLKPTVRATVAIARANGGVDVAYYGPYFERGPLRRLPLAWYYRAADYRASGIAGGGGPDRDDGASGADGGTAVGRERVRTTAVVGRERLLADPPPVIVAPSYQAGDLAGLSGYVCVAHRLEYWTDRMPGGPTTRTHVYLDRDALGAALDPDALDAYGSTLSSHRCGRSSSASAGSASGPESTASPASIPRSSTTAIRN